MELLFEPDDHREMNGNSSYYRLLVIFLVHSFRIEKQSCEVMWPDHLSGPRIIYLIENNDSCSNIKGE